MSKLRARASPCHGPIKSSPSLRVRGRETAVASELLLVRSLSDRALAASAILRSSLRSLAETLPVLMPNAIRRTLRIIFWHSTEQCSLCESPKLYTVSSLLPHQIQLRTPRTRISLARRTSGFFHLRIMSSTQKPNNVSGCTIRLSLLKLLMEPAGHPSTPSPRLHPAE